MRASRCSARATEPERPWSVPARRRRSWRWCRCSRSAREASGRSVRRRPQNAQLMRATLPAARHPRSGAGASKSSRDIGRRHGSTMFSTHPGANPTSSAAPVFCSRSAISPGRGRITVRWIQRGSRNRSRAARLRPGPPLRAVSFRNRTLELVVMRVRGNSTVAARAPAIKRSAQALSRCSRVARSCPESLATLRVAGAYPQPQHEVHARCLTSTSKSISTSTPVSRTNRTAGS